MAIVGSPYRSLIDSPKTYTALTVLSLELHKTSHLRIGRSRSERRATVRFRTTARLQRRQHKPSSTSPLDPQA